MAETRRTGAVPTPEDYPGYAYPLVAPLYRAANLGEDDPGLRERCFLDVFESIIKYIVTILVRLYPKDSLKELDDQIRRLSKPSLGHYANLLRSLLNHHKPPDKDLFGKLHDFYDDKVDPETFEQMEQLSKVVHYPTPKNARSYRHLIDVLIVYRNYVSHGAAASARDYQRRLPALVHLVGTLLERLEFIGKLPLVEVHSVRQRQARSETEVRVWNGLRPQRRQQKLEPPPPIGHLVLDRSAANLGFVDLFPYCVVLEADDAGQPDIYFLNNATTSRIKYLSYSSGKVPVIDRTHAHAIFDEVQRALEGRVEADESGLPEHMQGLLKVSEESQKEYHKALGELIDDEVDSAIRRLEHAIEKSPAFRDAVLELARLLEQRSQLEECRATLENYLKLVPDDVHVLLADARILLKLGHTQESEDRVRQILQDDPDNPEALAFSNPTLRSISEDTKTPFTARLSYEFFIGCIAGSVRNSKAVLALFIFLVTLLEAGVFVLAKDLMMALTILSLGTVWGSAVWATFHIRRLLGESRPNFMAFLHSQRLQQLLDDLILPVFGRFPEPRRRLAVLVSGLRDNAPRFAGTVVFAVIGTAWLYYITNYSAPGWATDLSYSAFVFLIFLSFGYLLSITLGYYRFLRDLRSQTIHFSLVQHPKLSIRYLSNLSRRLSYPLLVVSTLATFTLYLGPFIPKLTFIVGLLVFLVFVSYSYYSTIFLVRRVIIQNKWRLISKFSVHFDTPFDDLVVHARTSDLERLNELIEMRDFLDSMDVWAERKWVLAAVSLFYIGVLLFSTLGISNVMTRKVVPMIAKSVEKETAERGQQDLNIQDPAENIKLLVGNVDDTVLAFWGGSVDDMLSSLPGREERGRGAKDYCEVVEGQGSRRDDWRNSGHGALYLCVPVRTQDDEERHLLVVVYNKVYKSFLYMGGGKLSYDIDVRYGKDYTFHTQRTLRSNEKGIGYWVYFRFKKGGAQVSVLRLEAGAEVDDDEEVAIERRIRDFVADLSTELGEEEGAEVTLFRPSKSSDSTQPEEGGSSMGPWWRR